MTQNGFFFHTKDLFFEKSICSEIYLRIQRVLGFLAQSNICFQTHRLY